MSSSINALQSAARAVITQQASSQQKAEAGIEKMFLQELLKAGGAFAGGDTPGAQQVTDLITDTLSQVLADRGTLGIADVIMGKTETAPTVEQALLQRPDRASGSWDAAALVEHQGAQVSSDFGHRHDPLTGENRFHAGIDVAAPAGSAVTAALPGRVVFAGERGGYGNLVEIEHADGRTSRYAHLSAIAVHEGDAIAAGDPVGAVGSSGRSTGPHLHFELRNKGLATDPAKALQKYGVGADVEGTRPFGAASSRGQR